MKQIILIFMLLLPVLGMAQSEDAEKYFNTGRELFDGGKYAEAIPYFEKSYSINKNRNGDTLLSKDAIITCLSLVARNYSDNGQFREAIITQMQANDMFKNSHNENDTIFALLLDNLAYYNAQIGDYSESINLCTQALEIRKIVLGEAHPVYINTLSHLADYTFGKGVELCYAEKYEEAIPYLEKSEALEKNGFTAANHSNRSTTNIAIFWAMIAMQNHKHNNHFAAVKFGTKAIDLLKNMPDSYDTYAKTLHILASSCAAIGKKTEAIEYETLAVEIIGKNNPDEYIGFLSSLARYYGDIENYAEAIKLEKEVLEICKDADGTDNDDYLTALNWLAIYNDMHKNYSEAIKIGKQIVHIYKKKSGRESANYAINMNNLASYYSNISKFNKAIKLEKQLLKIRSKVNGKNHSENALWLNQIAGFYSEFGKYPEAIKFKMMAIKIRLDNSGKDFDYCSDIIKLSGLYLKSGNYFEAFEKLKEGDALLINLLFQSFLTKTYDERSYYWNMYSQFFVNGMLPHAYEGAFPELYNPMAYNSLLLSKGLLLKTEIDVKNLIIKSGKKDLEKLYNKICNNKVKLDELYEVPPHKRRISVDSLSLVINKDESFLLDSLKELGDYMQSLSIEWQDVQNKLSDKDIAIEFADFEKDCKRYYVALILKKGMSAPEMVKLDFEETDVDCFVQPLLYNKIWQPLEKYFSNEGNIYFSPSGILHTLAIEYATINDTMTISDRYKHLYRVSSTRNIALTVAHNTDNTAALFGGIEYGAERDTIVKYFADIARGSDSQDWGRLESTWAEAMSIDTILRQKGFKTEIRTQSAASEGNFKRLSGGNHRIIHIATHGYFHADSSSIDNLANSALVFAGANNIKPYDDIDDGLLTAQEISRLDLHNTDLVVLSACETALGTVTSEGVFGIQRGFKKAGANTIVMSIKDVYDIATKEFMVEFYKNMIDNRLSKHEAFVSAVHAMRKKYPNDPDKWAMFIMLDGIE